MSGNVQKSGQAPKYLPPRGVDLPDRHWPARTVEKCPLWCSVDMRDGNQALPNPMSPAQKLEYFQMLCRIGFKHIEVGFPSASKDDFDFFRKLVDEKRIPADVFIMGLVQCRAHLIEKTVAALQGAPRAIVHAYLATSDLHVGQVFSTDRAGTLKTAVEAVHLIRERCAAHPETDWRFEFSPEEFTDTDPDYALEICQAVFDAWGQATVEKPMILNLPATVERQPPGHYADRIEYFIRRFPARDRVLISLHAHNDQGMAVAATELALQAGADRVEGALFGHGERTGNVDLVTLAGNFMSRGMDVGLNLSDLNGVAATVERLTGLPIHYRQPYAGEYAFTAFSGSHQDAIRKGMQKLGEAGEKFGMQWKVPYLHIDPQDLGRSFEHLIRINSQSGKGGVAWVLEKEYGLQLPRAMQPEVGAVVQRFVDEVGREVSAEEVYEVFIREFVTPTGPFELIGYWPRPDDDYPAKVHGEIRLKVRGEEKKITADGNGPISAFVHAVRELVEIDFRIDDYHEQAAGKGADATAYAFVPLKLADGRTVYGVGTNTNIDQAAVQAIVSGLNRVAKQG